MWTSSCFNQEEGGAVYLKPSSGDEFDLRQYKKCGFFLGLLLRNSQQARMPLPTYFFAKILFHPSMLPAPFIADLKEVKPLIGKSLESTTEDYIDDMFLYFELTDKIGDGKEVSTTPFKEGG